MSRTSCNVGISAISFSNSFGFHKKSISHDKEDEMKKRLFSILFITVISVLIAFPMIFTAAAETVVKEVHFLIPGGAGGGWDTTARGVGRVLQKTGIVGNASFENMSGGGGGKASLGQAGGKYKDKLDEALRLVKSLV